MFSGNSIETRSDQKQDAQYFIEILSDDSGCLRLT
ncbi:hypothetical protein NIES2111_54630 [Nostoc sp. NIES-2111]|nr:hypothetical protein NIES2111_54630 [Nostoc sp. NIES-2111]